MSYDNLVETSQAIINMSREQGHQLAPQACWHLVMKLHCLFTTGLGTSCVNTGGIYAKDISNKFFKILGRWSK